MSQKQGMLHVTKSFQNFVPEKKLMSLNKRYASAF